MQTGVESWQLWVIGEEISPDKVDVFFKSNVGNPGLFSWSGLGIR